MSDSALDLRSAAILKVPQLKNYPSRRELAVLLAIAFGAILLHGYHPGVEDSEIYLPGIKKTLDPSLYPQNAAFFLSHAHMTLFPNLVAASVRVTHLPLGWTMFVWQWFSIFLLLLACWHFGRAVWRGSEVHPDTASQSREQLATWGGVALVAALLTIPVAGTALYIMDEYVTTRSLSTPAVVFIILNAVERKYGRSFLWAVFTALMHPLMVVFGVSFAVMFAWMGRHPAGRRRNAAMAAVVLFPLGLFPPVTDTYREVLNSRSYFFLLRWHWYEWLGIFAPLLLLAWFGRVGRSRNRFVLQRICSALIIYQLIFFAAALVITIPVSLAQYAELQPMRSLHLLYILFFAITGGLLAQTVLQNHAGRWFVLFIPLCAGMWFAQRELFPATPHLEWPGARPHNAWVQAFEWVRENTPKNAYFALNADYMALPGEDQHGFRAIAERSRMADAVKDSGAVTMFPVLAETWHEQVQAERGWDKFQSSDFARLKQRFGVNWVVLRQPGVAGLNCPYENQAVVVCRLE